MKFGFTALSDEAKEMLQKLHVRYYNKDSLWIIETTAYDVHEEEWMDTHPSTPLAGKPRELSKEYSSQGTRIAKIEGCYYYLIEEVVFFMRPKLHTDWRFSPPTVEEVTVLEVVDSQYQGSFRELLLNRPPNADLEEGGVLL